MYYLWSLISFLYVPLFFNFLVPNTVSGQCTSGFPDENTIESPPSSVPIYDRQFVFYSINFTCEMNISSWIFAAEINTQPVPPITERLNPELQIWRASTFSPDLLNLQSTVGVSEDPELISESLYRYTPNDLVTIMPGDVLGIRIAPMFGNPVTTYAPLFIDVGTGNTSEYFDDQFQSTGTPFIPTLENPGIAGRIGDQYVPLVTVEFGMIKFFFCTLISISICLCSFLFIYLSIYVHLPLSVHSLTSSFCIYHISYITLQVFQAQHHLLFYYLYLHHSLYQRLIL